AAAGAMGRAPRRRAPARTPPHAAARTFLADPLRAAGRGRERAGPHVGWWTTLTVRAHGREAVRARRLARSLSLSCKRATVRAGVMRGLCIPAIESERGRRTSADCRGRCGVIQSAWLRSGVDE